MSHSEGEEMVRSDYLFSKATCNQLQTDGGQPDNVPAINSKKKKDYLKINAFI